MADANKILVRMLDRLFASMVNGPSLNCRPHSSRQRVDLSGLGRFRDVAPEDILRALVGDAAEIKVTARVPQPRRRSAAPDRGLRAESQTPARSEDDAPVEAAREVEPAELTAEEQAAQRAWSEQQSLLAKLATIAEDARTYEQDTGVHVLNVGFPLLSLPPGTFRARGGSATRRIIAPVAFIPVNLSVQRGAAPSIRLDCRCEGSDRVMPNTALLAWLEQQTGQAAPELFADEDGEQPWREVCELVQHVAKLLGIDAPVTFATGAASEVEAPAGTMDAKAKRAPAPPSDLQLAPAPRADDEQEAATLITSAVLGLFPMTNQGLLRDMQALVAGEPLVGPVDSFVRVDVDLDAPVEQRAETPQVSSGRTRRVADERMVSAADPCQSRAVRLARECRGLVIHGPPGTGKSQTITNIIGDHLATGERVLVVCDKRTALDVVAHRLEHLGLGQLLAVIHDPQRDQRELYRSVREQLESLTEVKTHPKAEKQLEKVNAELQELHDELTRYYVALLNPTGEVASFHDLVGEWLSLPDANNMKLDEAKLAQIRLVDIDAREQPIQALLQRAESLDYGGNIWKDAAGIALPAFLRRPAEPFRAALAACDEAARQADATLDPLIPPFSSKAPLTDQGKARVELAEALKTVIERVDSDARQRWSTQDAVAIRRAAQQRRDLEPHIVALRSGPLDAELALTVRDRPPLLSDVIAQLGALEAYLQIATKWYAFACFGRKSRAAAVVSRYGQPLTPEGATRIRSLLQGLRARLVLRDWYGQMVAPPADNKLIDDAVLDRAMADHASLLDVLNRAHTHAPYEGLAESLQRALTDAAFAETLTEGLRKSAPRAESLHALDVRLQSCGLIEAGWRAALDSKLRGGQLAAATVGGLSQKFGTLEGVLRVRDELSKTTSPLRDILATLLDASLDARTGWSVLRRAALGVEIGRRLRNDPHLQSIDGQRLARAFERYRELEARKKDLVRDAILHRWVTAQQERLLAGTGTRLSSLGADVRRRLVMRGERAMRLRQVVAIGADTEGGDPLFDLRPVWLASPETVAQLFPRTGMFDVVIFDEASQCRLEEALPVLTRAQRVVIAGDPQQLPPTRFFESAIVASEDDEVDTDQQLFELQQGEVEDLLGAALNLSIQQCYLDVHYRSRNADLIEFSNEHFYHRRLQAIPGHPANRARFAPLTLYRAEGVYDDRCNEREAEQVVRIVRDLLKRAEPPSIGVACFNLQQRDLIVEKLDEAAAEDADFARRLAAARARKGAASFEGLFVKNLENVQGDERDHIIISTTYGPDPKGRFYRRFGPLGRAGGGRRLNVLVTRARQEVHLVTSIPPEVYRSLPAVPDGQRPGGGWLLFAYLAYAEQLAAAYERERANEAGASVRLADVHVHTSGAPSAFAEALGRRLAGLYRVGSEVHWGNDGLCVDLALRHPQRPADVTLGVLCDGVRYHAADDPVEWDLFRTAIHESQGWRLHRVWTPHFFRDPHGGEEELLRRAEGLHSADRPAEGRDGLRGPTEAIGTPNVR